MIARLGILLGCALLAAFPPAAHAQKAKARPCPALRFDVRAGTLNGLGPATTMATVKKRLPCFTGQSAEGELFNYGGGVFFTGHEVYFYTYLRFLEIRKGFKGAMSEDVFGKSREALARDFAFLSGKTDRPLWASKDEEFFRSTSGGCIKFLFKDDRLEEISAFTRDCGVLFEPR